MARRVFFSFHFDDSWAVNQIRNLNVIPGPLRAGFYDHSEYLEAKKKGDENISRMIRERLEGTSVTVVLIGEKTASRRWVKFEIAESVKRMNGMLGIYIHGLKRPGSVHIPLLSAVLTHLQLPPLPPVPQGIAFPAYVWDGDRKRLANEIEAAGARADARRGRARRPS